MLFLRDLELFHLDFAFVELHVSQYTNTSVVFAFPFLCKCSPTFSKRSCVALCFWPELLCGFLVNPTSLMANCSLNSGYFIFFQG